MRKVFLALAAGFLCIGMAQADEVHMKDGTVYKGKIMIDTDKSVLIGNPPFDPNSYLLQADDIAKIIYEEYHPNLPSERKRGFNLETRLAEQFFSSAELPLKPAPSLYFGGSFRVHPALELEGGLEWMPGLTAKDDFSVSDGTTTRRYKDFWQYGAGFGIRVYPFFQEKWKTEPFVTVGYSWNRMIPKDSGDRMSGAGWQVGAGFLRAFSAHLFWEARLTYRSVSFDTIQFLGQEGSLNPNVGQKTVSLSLGSSYRF